MFSALRKRMHLSPATAIATLALVFAMTGGAYAAKHYLINSTKQISPKVLRALKGKNGKNGLNGANGAAGAQGPAGPQGLAGAAGAKGDKGDAGPQGPQGDAGPQGPQGDAGVIHPGETLPVGATETGSWAIAPTSNFGYAAISFPIPLAEPLEGAEVHFINASDKKELFFNWQANGGEGELEELSQTACTGTVAAPTAASGDLCIYGQYIAPGKALFASNFVHALTVAGPRGFTGPGNPAPGSAGVSGAMIEAFPLGELEGWGTWAVTG